MWIASAKLLLLRAFTPDEEAPLMTGRMPKKVRFLDGEVGLFGRARDSWGTQCNNIIPRPVTNNLSSPTLFVV
jgi:hypothetical protein